LAKVNMAGSLPAGGWERKLFHLLAGSFFPVLAFFLSRESILLGVGLATAGALGGELLRYRCPGVNRWVLRWLGFVLKPQESHHLTGATYILLATLLLFALFPRGVAQAALLFLAWGDPAAALVGAKLGRRRWHAKSLEGGLAFLGVSLLVAVVLVPLAGVSLGVLVLGAGLAAFIEFWPLPLDDNLVTPVLSGLGMFLVGGAGWM